MGAPDPGMQAAEQPTGEALLTALRTIKAAERAKHASVLDYWLSIRGDKEFPPLHDLDPLEISDAGSCSILLELIGGGQDAEIRHLGDALKADVTVSRIIDSPNPSILSCIARKLPIVAISRDFLAFEDSFDTAGGWTRCWVTLLPLSSCGSWVDYVYAFVTVETGGGQAAKPVPNAPVEEAEAETAEETAAAEVPEATDEVVEAAVEESEEKPEEQVEPVEAVSEPEPEEVVEPAEAAAELETEEVVELTEPAAELEPVEAVEASYEPEPQFETEPEEPEEAPTSGPGFSKLLEGIAQLTGFYGQGVKVEDPVVHVEPAVTEPVPAEPEAAVEESEAVEATIEADEPAPIEEPVAIEQPVEDEFEPVPTPGDAEPEPAPAMEGSLQNKLEEVRAKADEARQAQLRAMAALHEGLSAAYDFALDAETSPEEYLRLVEAQGMKIQLRAPMAPVARLAFDGVCEAATIKQFEAVLAWALKEELPRGALLERIEQAGGVAELLSEVSRPS